MQNGYSSHSGSLKVKYFAISRQARRQKTNVTVL